MEKFENGNERAARLELERIEKIDNSKVGDGLTVSLWSDAHAGTIIKRTAKTIWVQRDEATLIKEPKFIVGGFAGICTNNRDLEYTYKADLGGMVNKITKRKNGRWKLKGYSLKTASGNVYVGRNEYYDYGF